MYLKRSGKAPDILKTLAVTVLTITLCGCQPQTASSSDPPSSVMTEPPDTSGTSETSQTSQVSQTSEVSTDNTHVPETSEPSVNSDNSSDTESAVSVDSTDSGSESTDTSEPVPETSESTSSSEPISTSSSSEEPPESSSSSSVVEPPPEIIIPDVKVPTSPGSQLITGTNGVIDYSNSAQGYISARYTGSSAKVKFRINANGAEYNFDLDPNGATEYYPLEYGSGTYTCTIFEQIPGSTRYAEAALGSFSVTLNSVSQFLYPNQYVNFNQSSDVVYKAAELCAGKTSTIDKIAAIFTWVAENVSYDYNLAATVKSGYIPDPDRTLSKKTGICLDYASLMAAMLRSQSIPARIVIGNASPDIYHAWNEVYTEETGWITPELLLGNSGYNLVDATFYSTSANKQQIADYISNKANYTAVNYR